MNDATTLDRPVQPTLQVRQIVPGQNYREHYDAKALADLREQVKAAPEYAEGKPIVVLGAAGKLKPLGFVP